MGRLGVDRQDGVTMDNFFGQLIVIANCLQVSDTRNQKYVCVINGWLLARTVR